MFIALQAQKSSPIHVWNAQKLPGYFGYTFDTRVFPKSILKRSVDKILTQNSP